MTCRATVELTDLKLVTAIGAYGPGDEVPDLHLLDLTIDIDPDKVLIDRDDMAEVFDYDPLIVEIDRLARDAHYETQERLMTRIVAACAQYVEIRGLEIFLRKAPVRAGSGALGVRLAVDAEHLGQMR